MIYLYLDYKGIVEVKSMREIKQITCTQCHNKYYDDQDTCPFCGHTTRRAYNESNRSDDFFKDEPKVEHKNTSSKLEDQDIIILVILAVVFWPAALIYYFVKIRK